MNVEDRAAFKAAVCTLCSVAFWFLGLALFAFREFQAAGWSFIFGGVLLIYPVALAWANHE